jgi:hypothetical protein
LVSMTVVLALGWSPDVTAVTIVSPSADTSVEGNRDNGFPFNLAFFGFSSERYEQVYESSDFGSSPLLITGLAFRPDAQVGSAFSRENLQRSLSLHRAS